MIYSAGSEVLSSSETSLALRQGILYHRKKHLRGLGVPCTHGIHMVPWLCKTVINIYHIQQKSTPPSAITLNSWDLRLGSWASNYTPVGRSGLHTSLSSHALSVILRVSFSFWDCTNCCAVPSSWAGTLKPLLVWSHQDTVTWNLCDANVFVGCSHPLGRNSVGHTALSPSDQKNLQRNQCGYCVTLAQITTHTPPG